MKPTNVICDLGVLVDSKLAMLQHIGKIMELCHYHFQRLKKVRCILGPTITCRLVSTFVLSRLNYCNSILAVQSPPLRTYNVSRMQRYVRCVVSAHVTMWPNLRDLHWLPTWFSIVYKLCLIMHNVHTGCSPGYIKEILMPKQQGCLITAGYIHQPAPTTLRTTCPSPQDWRARFFICRSYLIEQFTKWIKINVRHYHVLNMSQDIFLNSPLTFHCLHFYSGQAPRYNSRHRLSFDTRISALYKSCFFNIRALRHIHPALTMDCALIRCQLKYANVDVMGVSERS